MSNYTYIYKKNNDEIKLIDSLNYTLEEFQGNPQGCYPTWNKSTMVASEIKYEYPVIDVSGELREKTREELILTENKVELLQEGEYLEAGKIIKVEYNEELGYLKPVWNRDLKQWLEGATDLEKVQAQISEYSELDTPSTLKEMGTELANECMDMLIQLRGMAYGMENATEVDGVVEARDLLVLPKPSEKLKQFKNKYNSIR